MCKLRNTFLQMISKNFVLNIQVITDFILIVLTLPKYNIIYQDRILNCLTLSSPTATSLALTHRIWHLCEKWLVSTQSYIRCASGVLSPEPAICGRELFQSNAVNSVRYWLSQFLIQQLWPWLIYFYISWTHTNTRIHHCWVTPAIMTKTHNPLCNDSK